MVSDPAGLQIAVYEPNSANCLAPAHPKVRLRSFRIRVTLVKSGKSGISRMPGG